MVARAVLAAHRTIDARRDEAPGQLGTEQDLVEPEPGVALPPLPHVVPVRVHRRVRVERANGVEPALREEPRVGLAARGLAAPSQSDWFGRNQVTRQQTMRSQTPLVKDPHLGAAFSLGLSTST